MTSTTRIQGERWIAIVSVATIGLALVGFLVGIGQATNSKRFQSIVHENNDVANSISATPSYGEIDSIRHGANRDGRSDLRSLQSNTPTLFDLVDRTPEMKNEALQDRLRTRAFDGAPPVIPHWVDQQTTESCLVCHLAGTKLGERIATKMCHVLISNCTQCHVEQVSTRSFSTLALADGASRAASISTPGNVVNAFVGVVRAGGGNRAMAGAPPTIPHSLHMRTECMSCHGLVARPGIRTTHPWLQNCLQCHATDVEIDLRPNAN